MKICLAQSKSKKGDIRGNIEKHMTWIRRAIQLKADLIVFPELSISSYEPELAAELACHEKDSIFEIFQELSNTNEITIAAGMPTKQAAGIAISMLIFQPNKARSSYSKQMLHSDETPYFIAGNKHTILKIKGKNIALAICYESLQREHFLEAFKLNADMYLASVAKPQAGIDKAIKHFPQIAKEFNVPILMVNCVGACDNFISVGQSAVWKQNGDLIEVLDNENEGLLIYDTEKGLTQKEQLRIEKASLNSLDEIWQLYFNAKIEMEKQGIDQWTKSYPAYELIEKDLKKGLLFTLKKNMEIVAAINLSEEQEAEYQSIDWQFDNSKVLVIHRLVVDPTYQKQGYARFLMDFAENYAQKNHYSSIRLDAYSQNKRVLNFYQNRNYHTRGKVYFPERKEAFLCMEKEIKTK